MNGNDSQQINHNQGKPRWLSLSRVLALVIIAIIGYYLILEHRAHIGDFLASFPWWILLFLLCPLMHLLHGHGEHDKHKGHNKE